MAMRGYHDLTPPYLPFSRFLNSLDSVSVRMPTRIDRASWIGCGETAYLGGLLVSAYRFLHLTDGNGTPTDLLRLATDQRVKRPSAMHEVLVKAYDGVLDDVVTAQTDADVEKALSRFRLRGATYRKAVSFLVQACGYAGLKLPRFLTNKTRVSHAKSVRRPTEGGIEMTGATVKLRSGGEITLSGRFDVFSCSPGDRKFVLKLFDELNAYEAEQGVEQPQEEDPWPEKDEGMF